MTPELTEIRFTADQALMEKINTFKARLAHKNPNPTHAELLHMIADIALERLTPKESRKTITARKYPTQTTATSPARYIDTQTRSIVWRRDDGRCSYVCQRTGKRCNSRHALQWDHIKPVALGGTSEAANIRLLCRNHNQLEAIRIFGSSKMAMYIPTIATVEPHV